MIRRATGPVPTHAEPGSTARHPMSREKGGQAVPDSGYLRYVALGDSQTEGLGDGDDTLGLRGWADRNDGRYRLGQHLLAAPVVRREITGTPLQITPPPGKCLVNEVFRSRAFSGGGPFSPFSFPP